MSKRENNLSVTWPRELVRWFEREHRPMPWRSDPSPYKAREILEETGITIRVGAPVVTVKHAYSHFKITMTAFRCEWLSGRARPKAAVELKWILPVALVDYPMPRANRRIAEAHTIRSGKS